MYGDENAAILHAAFVALGFVFGNAHSDECADQAASCCADAKTCKSAHDGTCRDERSKARNRESADSCKEPERAAHDAARGCACGGTFRRFRVLFGAEFPRGINIRCQYGYVVIAKSCGEEHVDAFLCRDARRENTKRCCVFSGHV